MAFKKMALFPLKNSSEMCQKGAVTASLESDWEVVFFGRMMSPVSLSKMSHFMCFERHLHLFSRHAFNQLMT